MINQMLQTNYKGPDISAYPPYVQRANKVAKMLQGQMKTMIANRTDEATLFSTSFNNGIFMEYLQFQRAVFNRLIENQKSLFTGIAGVVQEHKEMKAANTLSKYIAQECNIMGQWSALMLQQATNWTEMIENIQTDYDYWISQKKQASKK